MAELAARRIDATDRPPLPRCPSRPDDQLSRSVVVDVDNAIRTSDHELALATEAGNTQTDPFAKAVNAAKVAIAQAFNVRQQLDDAIPETPPSAETCGPAWWWPRPANRELDTQTRLSTNCAILSSTLRNVSTASPSSWST